jgi:hypothetical protein
MILWESKRVCLVRKKQCITVAGLRHIVHRANNLGTSFIEQPILIAGDISYGAVDVNKGVAYLHTTEFMWHKRKSEGTQSNYSCQFFVVVVQCKTSALGDESLWMLEVVQRFGKYFSYHLQGEFVLVGSFWKPYIFVLKMATAMSAETSDNFKHSTRLISKSRSFIHVF